MTPAASPRSSSPRTHPPAIPVLLLKTQSQPHDAYHEYFSTTPATPRDPSSSSHISSVADPTTSSSSTFSVSEESTPALHFRPLFVPVLEHRPNTGNLGTLEDLLQSGRLGQKYGGMIFTSQRAVEAWSDVVKRVERSSNAGTLATFAEDGSTRRAGVTAQIKDETTSEVPLIIASGATGNSPTLVDDDFIFPLYSVGPATSRALNTLVSESASPGPLSLASPFSRLHPSVLGEHTGNGANLARYIVSHYNRLQSRKQYTFYEAPRLPFTPQIGPPKGERMHREDARLQKRELLFLVGEQRRDIIPKTLMDKEGKLAPEERIQVDEVEVYMTGIMESFKDDFRRKVDSCREEGVKIVVVVVFSPQGCEAMLRSLGYIDEELRLTGKAKHRWGGPPPSSSGSPNRAAPEPVYVIVTIGPTTRDHLKDKFGFQADVCASKPSPQGLGDGLLVFLREKRLV